MTRTLNLALSLLLMAVRNIWAGPFIELPELRKTIDCEWLPSEEDYPEDDGIYLLVSRAVEMKIDNNHSVYSVETVHVLMRLFRNIEKHNTVSFTVGEGEKLVDLDARTIKNDGSTTKLNREDVLKMTGKLGRYKEHSYSFSFPSVEKGHILEYRYVIRKSVPFVFDVWWIQGLMPVKRNVYTLTVPGALLSSEWKWRYKAYAWENLPKPKDITPDFLKKSMVYSWTISDVPAFRPEPMMPSQTSYCGHVKFTPSDWRKWEDVSRWYYSRYLSTQMVADEVVTTTATKLTSGCQTQQEALRALYRYVQKIRYESIPLGEGGLRPYAPAKVLERNYGDCKDKAILLIAMLKAKGINASPVLLKTADKGELDPTFPTWAFNHMIVKAILDDGSVYWLDPTSTHSRVVEIPAMVQGVDALVITGDTTCVLEKIPASTELNNTIDITTNVTITDNGDAAYKIVISYRGCEAEKGRSKFWENSESQLREYCRSLVVDAFLEAKLTNCSVSNLDDPEKDLLLNFNFVVPNALKRQGDLYFLTHNPIDFMRNTGWLGRESRNFPMDFSYPFTINAQYSISYPKALYATRNKPRADVVEGPSLFYRSVFNEAIDGQLTATESFIVKKRMIPPVLYKRVKEFFAEVHKLKNDKIILVKK